MQIVLKKAEKLVPFVKSSFVYTTTAFAVSLLNYYFNLSLARVFPLSDYGEYMATLSYVLLLSVPVGALSAALIKRIGRAEESERWHISLSLEAKILRTLWQQKFILLALAVLTVVILSVFRLRFESALIVVALWLLSATSSLYPTVLQAGRRFVWVSLLLIIVTSIKVGGLWINLSSLSLLFVYGLLIGSSLIQIGLGAWLLRKLAAAAPPSSETVLLNWQLGTILRRQSVYLPALSSLGLMGMITIDIILAKMVLPADAVGLYAGLSLLAKIVLYLTGPLTAVAYTFFAGSETKSNAKAILLFCSFLIVAATAVVGGIYVWQPQFIINLFLGPSYDSIGSVLWLAAIFGGLYSIATLVTQYLIAHGRQLGLLSLVAVAAQIVGIVLFHGSLTQVMAVNSIVALSLCVGYAIGLLRSYNGSTKQ